MTISFNQTPSNSRVPFVSVEVDNSRAAGGPALLNYRALLICQKTSAGSGAANSIHRVSSAAEVRALCGPGSLGHRLAVGYFKNNQKTETFCVVIAENGSGVAATGSVALTGPATEAGTLSLLIGGQRVRVAVSKDDTASQVGDAIDAAIAANADLPVTSQNTTGTVGFTAKGKGEYGNDIDIRLNYYDGEKTPAGIAATITAMHSGATNPDLTDAITALADVWYHIVAHPYYDSGTLDDLEAELASRFGPARQIPAVAITSEAGIYSDLANAGNDRNSPHSCIVAQPGKSPATPAFEFAGMVAGVVAKYGQIDPSRPLQTLPLVGALPPADTDLFTGAQRDTLLHNGIGATGVGPGGVVQIDRVATTYQLDASGAPDDSYLDVTTLLTLMYLRYSFRARIASRYPRHKLANDGTRFGAGQAIITPKLGKAEALAWFREMEELGLVEDFDQFKTDLVVERNLSDPNRLDFLLPPNLINQLIGTATLLQFLL